MSRLLLASVVGCSLATQACAASANPQPSVTPLEAQKLGAILEPRWPGSADLVPRIGIARVEWAFAVRFPGTSSIESADLDDLGPVTVKLRNGTCFTLAPSVNGRSTQLFASTASCAPSHSGYNNRSRRTISSRSGDFSVELNPAGDRSTLFFKSRLQPSSQVLTIPMSVIAIGSLPDPHGLTYQINLFGTRSNKPVMVGLTVLARDLQTTAPMHMIRAQRLQPRGDHPG